LWWNLFSELHSWCPEVSWLPNCGRCQLSGGFGAYWLGWMVGTITWIKVKQSLFSSSRHYLFTTWVKHEKFHQITSYHNQFNKIWTGLTTGISCFDIWFKLPDCGFHLGDSKIFFYKKNNGKGKQWDMDFWWLFEIKQKANLFVSKSRTSPIPNPVASPDAISKVQQHQNSYLMSQKTIDEWNSDVLKKLGFQTKSSVNSEKVDHSGKI
jgi:hypothetical protein